MVGARAMWTNRFCVKNASSSGTRSLYFSAARSSEFLYQDWFCAGHRHAMIAQDVLDCVAVDIACRVSSDGIGLYWGLALSCDLGVGMRARAPQMCNSGLELQHHAIHVQSSRLTVQLWSGNTACRGQCDNGLRTLRQSRVCGVCSPMSGLKASVWPVRVTRQVSAVRLPGPPTCRKT